MIRFEDVVISYGEGPEVLSGVTFHLAPGSFHFITGPSGAGKSSLLRLMYLANMPSAGQIYLFGQPVENINRKGRAELRRKIGVVFQDFRLLPHMTAAENVALPLRIAGRPEDKIKQHVAELLAWVGLADHCDDLPETLSGGQQQRIAIARAVITRPSLLLADEPTGNVDDRIALRLLYLFEELNKMGTTVVIATHSEQLMARLNHPVIRLTDKALYLETPQPKASGTAIEAEAEDVPEESAA
ncbi:MAG: cell division ATP-binding protein FtsE [Pseudomonadota bacterium]